MNSAISLASFMRLHLIYLHMNNKSSDLVSNKRAFHHFEILETFEAGIALEGTEIKSLRDNGGSLQESYIKVINREAWLIGSHIAPYKYGNIHNHLETRDRKLLLHKREIFKLRESVQEKGLTIVALALYLKEGKVKAKIAIAKGKKSADKREAIKERDEKRYMQKMLKSR
ncbi:SsrA-binding protein [Neochlamydia sp. AcF65]|nr:SsrA-binding protein [Neochlamydia sp. AcF65]MBS4170570.1 SsrA-binding protein [Neochlamydia sp. AcF95]NGY96111.1 SsrA-binding protein [Neochlamydia sp. AcF84]